MTEIRDALETDYGSILKLNDAEVQQTSPMDLDRLRLIVGMSCYHKVATVHDQVAAFIIALREGAAYDSENYAWFASRFPSFLYVDRIVVGESFSGKQVGSSLYNDLFTFARVNGVAVITCEYNLVPPNLASQAFHEKFGFQEIDTQWVASGMKQVSLQVAEL
ncbi:MAG: GNAT family N-acetyltransferase [SAR324 cluster bacterium]|nr:GNAT family N-acetyltransferase [SAR324 cluster bacterium]